MSHSFLFVQNVNFGLMVQEPTDSVKPVCPYRTSEGTRPNAALSIAFGRFPCRVVTIRTRSTEWAPDWLTAVAKQQPTFGWIMKTPGGSWQSGDEMKIGGPCNGLSSSGPRVCRWCGW